MRFRHWIGSVIVMGAAGCTPPATPRLNAPPQGDAEHHPKWAEVYAYHNDQAMMADMAIADIHFIPHTAILSGTGETRLERYAELLATIGGTIHYDPTTNDAKLVDARLCTAREFLAQAMPGTKPVEVVLGMEGGRGMTADEASKGRKEAYDAEKRGTAYKLNIPGASSGGSSGK